MKDDDLLLQMDQPQTELITMAPPIKAKTPGASPLKRNTHRGFSKGSIALISAQDRGEQCRIARP